MLGRPNSNGTRPASSPHPLLELPEPNPGFKATMFIAWLKKGGAVQRLSKCMFKWSQEGLDIEQVIKRLGTLNIDIY